MKQNSPRRGFTLIELLVVVLIIAILAAIALPQYQKAVQKVRLAEVAITSNALMKDIDLYILANGIPDGSFYFTTGDSPADISIPCTNDTGASCAQEEATYTGVCYFKSSCEVQVALSANKFGNIGRITFSRTNSSSWKISTISGNEKLLCQWAKDTYGLGMIDTYVQERMCAGYM